MTSPDRRDFLAALRDRAATLPSAVLKHAGRPVLDLPLDSDLDLLVERRGAAELAAWAREQRAVERCDEVRRAHMRTLRLYFRDGGYLQLDLLHAFRRKDLEYLDAGRVLRSARPGADGWAVPGVVEEFEYTWLFYLLNGADVPARHRARFTALAAEERAGILDAVRARYGVQAPCLAALLAPDAATRSAARAAVVARPANRAHRRAGRALRYAAATLRGTGPAPVITLSGVDGAGKTTVLEAVRAELETRYRRRVVVLRHRPGLVPILSALVHGRAEAERRAASTLPRQGRNRSRLSSLARFSYYLADYLLGQLWVLLRHSRQDSVVLYDRYYFDFVADPERSNVRLPDGFTRFWYRFLLRPRLNVFLYADAAEIRARKQELEVPAIERLTRRYTALFRSLAERERAPSRYVAIRNDRLEPTLRGVLGLVRDSL